MAKDPEKKPKKESYGAESITVLEGLDPVRKRPGMYIGSTGTEGLHHLITEIFDNSRDEAMAGHADHIEVSLLPGNRVRVVDNGRGIPVDIHPKTKVSALETILTVLHAGGKFGGDESGYKVSGGLHGVGSSVVNALSVYMRAEIHKNGEVHMQEYSIGKPKAKVKAIGKTKFTGTIITFEPDIEIFKEIKFNWSKIINRLREQAYLAKKLRITAIDARENKNVPDLLGKVFLKDLAIEAPSMSFYFESGLPSMVRALNIGKKNVHDTLFYVEKSIDDINVEIALQYVDDIDNKIIPFANHIYTMEGGMHVTGFKTALTRTLNTYNKEKKILKDGETFDGGDVLEGLTAVISIKMPEIQFEGQTKAKLGSPEARGAVETVFGEAIGTFFEEHPDEAKAILQKAVLALRARKAAKAAKDSILRKGALEGFTLPGKLSDCQSGTKPEDAEIFIVEGDSAGGTAKQGRDRKTQAILPLRGKILNVERARLDKLIANNEVKNLVIALGTSIGETFDIGKIRYQKIVIATDADVDGAHIRTLLLTLFYRYMRPVIESGYMYIAQPPLYKIKKGKEIAYAFSDQERDKVIESWGGNLSEVLVSSDEESIDDESEESSVKTKSTKSPKIDTQRYKGLGEMNASELWETTMDPDRRVLKQVTIDDAIEADKTFDILMGTDVPARKAFIQTNAKSVELDI